MSSSEEAPPFHGAFTKDVLYELHRRQPQRSHFMTKFNAKSASWKDFELVVLDGELRDFARCVHCKNFVSYSSKKGTGSMLRHRCHAKESCFTAEEHNRFREMEFFLRSTPQPLGFPSLPSPFLPRIKVEVPDPPDSPLRSSDGCHTNLNRSCTPARNNSRHINTDEEPLDVRINPRSPDGVSRTYARTAAGAPVMESNGEVEEIVANVELADDSSADGAAEDRRDNGRTANFAAARALAERQLAELQRLHAEEEHKLKIELLKKQHAVADLQRKYWRLKVKALSQKAFHGDNKAVAEDDSDTAE
uniref:BED-type domain-containing protein n=1 Tax=Ixodes ricinus TaxID=34613 RepID=A0A090XDC9_IXORI